MNQELKKLIYPDRVYSRMDVLCKPSPVPKKPGVYAWFFTDELSIVPTSEYIQFNDLRLLYVGIAPHKPSKEGTVSRRNLYRRLRYHYNGNAYGSTLRLSLGCLLSEKLGIQLRRVGKSGNRKTFTKEGESALSSWMEKNAFVTWIQHEAPWELEKLAINEFDLPLNIKGNRNHLFHKTLTNIRRLAKEKASKLPIA